jgi:hypothetical protein
MEKDCKDCKQATGGTCTMHSQFFITPDYLVKPQFILTMTELVEIRRGQYKTVQKEIKRIY